MKKTLVALAVMAATGASFAQVTLSGTVASGYKDQISADGAQSRTTGFGVDTATINFTAKEDIGGGQSIEAKLGLANVSRGSVAGTSLEAESTAFGPGDLTLTYTNTSVGRIQMGTERGAALMAGIPSAGAPVVDMDGKIYQLRSSSDFVSYAAPIGPVIFAYKYSESSATKGLGQGTSGTAGSTAIAQRTNDLALIYKQDGLELVGAYRMYDNRDPDSMTTGNSLTKETAMVLQAGYDLGFAKVGFGYNDVKASASGVKLTDMMIGVSAPMGPLTVGATLGRETVSGIDQVPSSYFNVAAVPAAFRSNAGIAVRAALSAADGTANSMSLGAKYDLSKRTSLTVNYARWTRSGYAQFEAVGAASLAAATAAATTTMVGATASAINTASGGLLGVPTTVASMQPHLNAIIGGNAGLTAAATATAAGAAAQVGYVLNQAAAPTATQAAAILSNAGAFTTGAAASAAAQTAANNAGVAASSMGYKADGSEFNILLSYSF